MISLWFRRPHLLHVGDVNTYLIMLIRSHLDVNSSLCFSKNELHKEALLPFRHCCLNIAYVWSHQAKCLKGDVHSSASTGGEAHIKSCMSGVSVRLISMFEYRRRMSAINVWDINCTVSLSRTEWVYVCMYQCARLGVISEKWVRFKKTLAVASEGKVQLDGVSASSFDFSKWDWRAGVLSISKSVSMKWSGLLCSIHWFFVSVSDCQAKNYFNKEMQTL